MNRTTALLWASLICGGALSAQTDLLFLNDGRTVLDAHNCYPYDGQWADRIDRALAAGFPISIEQDLAWYVDPATGRGRAVIAHNPKAMTGAEPGLREHFFERIRPIVEKALREQNRGEWPLITLHLDLKTVDAPLPQDTWKLLGDYENWITTAPKTADTGQLAPLDRKPVLVLTEDSDAQEKVFFEDVPVGQKLRLFGSAHLSRIQGNSPAERARFAATAPPETLLSEKPTNYRRWWNNSWAVVEEGGQAKAGDWTDSDAARLRALVQHAHKLGFWSRFYTLDGFTAAEDQGWDANYNFGSRDAAVLRWKAAIDAGVDFLSTDQYEDVGKAIADGHLTEAARPGGVRMIAHRGGVVDARYAENSPASLEAAVANAYWMIESDIRETKDGRIITHHDPDFVRFYNDSHKVAELTLAEIRALRATPGGSPPMTFAELMESSKGRLKLMLDIKDGPHPLHFYQEMETELAQANLLSSAYFIDLPEARTYFKGKARVSATFAQLKEAVERKEDVQGLYFLFEWGKTLTEEQVRFAQRYHVPVIPSVNTFHYERDKTEPIAAGTADIQRLRAMGVTDFQIDSVYEPAFQPAVR